MVWHGLAWHHVVSHGLVWIRVVDRLTTVAFKQVLAGIVPPISYLTRLDVYALASLAFLLLACAMHATIGYLIDDCDLEDICTFHPKRLTNAGARTLDYAFLGVYLGAWLSANVLYCLSVLRRLRRGRTAFSLANAKSQGFVPAQVAAAPRPWYDDGGSGRVRTASLLQAPPVTAAVEVNADV